MKKPVLEDEDQEDYFTTSESGSIGRSSPESSCLETEGLTYKQVSEDGDGNVQGTETGSQD